MILTIASIWLAGFLSLVAGMALRGWMAELNPGDFKNQYIDVILVSLILWPFWLFFGLYILIGDWRRRWE